MKLKTIRNPWSNPDQKPGNSLPTAGGWCAQLATRKTSRHSPRKADKRRKHIVENFTKSSFLEQRKAAESRLQGFCDTRCITRLKRPGPRKRWSALPAQGHESAGEKQGVGTGLSLWLSTLSRRVWICRGYIGSRHRERGDRVDSQLPPHCCLCGCQLSAQVDGALVVQVPVALHCSVHDNHVR